MIISCLIRGLWMTNRKDQCLNSWAKYFGPIGFQYMAVFWTRLQSSRSCRRKRSLAPPTLILTRPARILAPLLVIIIKLLTAVSHQIHSSPSRRRILPNSLFSSLCQTMRASSRRYGGTGRWHTRSCWTWSGCGPWSWSSSGKINAWCWEVLLLFLR